MSIENSAPPFNKQELVRSPARRLREIERRTIQTGPGIQIPGGDRFPGYSFPAAAAGDLAPIWEATRDIAYVEAIINCVSAGSGTGSFRLDVNGAPLITLSLLIGETTHTYSAVFSLGSGSRLGGELTVVSGQIVISVQLVEAT